MSDTAVVSFVSGEQKKECRNNEIRNRQRKQGNSAVFRDYLCWDADIISGIYNFKLGFNGLSYAKGDALDSKSIG